eukprot:1158063-Pelagomonas_calceolata.AAC.1
MKKKRRQRKLSLHQKRKKRHAGSKEPCVSSTTKLQKQKLQMGTWRIAGSTLNQTARTPFCIPSYLFKDLDKGVMRN